MAERGNCVRDDKGRFLKGNLTGSGRVKGVRNRSTEWQKSEIMEAYAEMGGLEALISHYSKPENISAFYERIWRPCLPNNLNVVADVTDFSTVLEAARLRGTAIDGDSVRFVENEGCIQKK